MIKRCPNHKWHWNNECRCIEKNPFFYYDGKWHTIPYGSNNLNDHSMLSLSGQLKNSDFLKDILKHLLVYFLVFCLIFSGIVYVCVVSGYKLKGNTQKQIEQNQ